MQIWLTTGHTSCFFFQLKNVLCLGEKGLQIIEIPRVEGGRIGVNKRLWVGLQGVRQMLPHMHGWHLMCWEEGGSRIRRVLREDAGALQLGLEQPA